MLSVQHYFFLAAVVVASLAPQSTYASCKLGYGQTPQNTCIKCPTNCILCDSTDVPAGQCHSCADGYGLSPQKTCTVKCPESCLLCDSSDVPAGQCNSCSPGYGLTAAKTCAKCPEGCEYCDSADVPAGQCKDCNIGYDIITPENTCAKDCSRYDCCTYDCPLAKAGTCSEEYGNFGDLKPMRVISWKTSAKRLTVKTCKAACLNDPTCFAYRFYGTQLCVGSRPCTRCSCKVLGQHVGDCSLYGENAKDGIQAQSSGSGYIFITRLGGYCWH